MDIQMPVLDGHKETRQMKGDVRLKATPIIAIELVRHEGQRGEGSTPGAAVAGQRGYLAE